MSRALKEAGSKAHVYLGKEHSRQRTANANPEVHSLRVPSGQNEGGKNGRECDPRAARTPSWAAL